MSSSELTRVERGMGGLTCVRVASPEARGEMYLHGGHVMSWAPAGGEDVLFVSRQARWEPGRAIRGGVPVCFPWFGAHRSRSDAPSHGFARTREWRLDGIEETASGVVVTMCLESDDETRRSWPHEFRLVHRVTFGRALTMELVTTNTGDVPFHFEEALHTYFRVAAIDRVRIHGLDDLRYLDTLTNPPATRTESGVITFEGETDRIYLAPMAPIAIEDDGRRVTLQTVGAGAAVVWNPWIAKARALADLGDDEWTGFVCVETCNVEPRGVDLAAGETHVMSVTAVVDALS